MPNRARIGGVDEEPEAGAVWTPTVDDDMVELFFAEVNERLEGLAIKLVETESRPGELVRIRLEFFKPMAAVNTTEFRFRPAGEDTAVTWTMTGQNNFLSKMFCLFVDMDRMVGGMFDQGLSQMKTVLERRP